MSKVENLMRGCPFGTKTFWTIKIPMWKEIWAWKIENMAGCCLESTFLFEIVQEVGFKHLELYDSTPKLINLIVYIHPHFSLRGLFIPAL